jgi:hypothetical protein
MGLTMLFSNRSLLRAARLEYAFKSCWEGEEGASSHENILISLLSLLSK